MWRQRDQEWIADSISATDNDVFILDGRGSKKWSNSGYNLKKGPVESTNRFNRLDMGCEREWLGMTIQVTLDQVEFVLEMQGKLINDLLT